MSTVISVEHLSKTYRLGQVSTRLRQSTRRIGTGTLTYDMKLWWAKVRGKPNPLLKIGESDHARRATEDGRPGLASVLGHRSSDETIWALKAVCSNV